VQADPQNYGSLVLSWFAAGGPLYTIDITGNLASPNWQSSAGVTDIVGDNIMGVRQGLNLQSADPKLENALLLPVSQSWFKARGPTECFKRSQPYDLDGA
jgi:hypothetical protein